MRGSISSAAWRRRSWFSRGAAPRNWRFRPKSGPAPLPTPHGSGDGFQRGQGIPQFGTIRVRTLHQDRSEVLWESSAAGWTLHDEPPDLHTQNHATRGTQGVLVRKINGCAAVILRQPPRNTVPLSRWTGEGLGVRGFRGRNVVQTALTPGPSPVQRERGDNVLQPISFSPEPTATDNVSLAVWDGRRFQSRMSVSGPNLEGLGIDAAGAMLLRTSVAPEKSTSVQLIDGNAELVRCVRRGLEPGPVVVAKECGTACPPPRISNRGQPTASGGQAVARVRPTIIVQGSGEELVALHAPSKTGAAVERWRLPGRSQGANWPYPLGAVIANFRGDYDRQVLYVKRAPSGCARLAAVELNGKPRWHHDFEQFPGDAPVWNLGGAIFWQAGHFTDPTRPDVLVTLRRSMMHSDETFLLSGADGRLLWRRPRQISARGCGGQPFAIGDFNGDGRDDAASFYPSIFYVLDGPSGRDLIAKDCNWPGLPMQPVYWGQPVALRIDDSSRPDLLFTTTGRSMVGLARPDGSLTWSDAYDRAASGLPAIGDFDGDGKLDILWIGFDDGSRCYDATSGRILWKLPLGAGQNIGSAVSGDINADGRDEAIFVLGQSLHCVGADGPGKPGRVHWTLDLPTRVSTPAIADAAGDGSLSILLAGADGNVYCIQ